MQSHNLKDRARELRQNATRQEERLWYDFLRTHPVKFRRQQQIGPYIADFFCPKARVITELDGSGHFQPDGIEYDRWRDAYLSGNGIRVLRFTNTQVDKEFSSVCETIDLAVTPSVSPSGCQLPRKGGAK